MKSSLTRARTANNQHVLVDVVLGNLVAAHHDALSLRQENVLVKLGINIRLNVLRRSP